MGTDFVSADKAGAHVFRNSRSRIVRVAWGCIIVASSAVASDVTYEYDSYGRLETATYRDGASVTATVIYEYDGNGNRTSATTSGVTRGSLSLTTPSYTAGEASGQRIVTVNVQRAGGSFGLARVNYATVNGSAVANGMSGDYVATSGTLTWEHGDVAAKSFAITILDDTEIESPESFSITLSAAIGAELSVPTNASVSIADDDRDIAPPVLPANPTFTEVTAFSAKANWTTATDNVGVTGYRYRVDASEWQTVGNVNLAVLTGLNSGTSYTFELQARDAAENWSVSRSGTFTTNYLTPGAPDQLSFSNVTATSATASWSTEPGVTGYQYRLDGGPWQDLGYVTSVALTGLTCGTSYSFEARATNAVGIWGPANFGVFTTVDNCPPDLPGAPNFFNITATSASANWTVATDNVGVTGYRYRLNGGGWNTSTNNSADLTGLTCATTYAVEVQARDAAANWSSSSSASFTTIDGCAPEVPGTPSVTNITANSATANWAAAYDNVGVTGYRYRLNAGAWQTPSNIPPANLAGLSCATPYTLDVQARDAVGNWGPSSSGSFTTPDGCAPGAPGTPTFTSVTATSVTASWGAASDTVGVTGYRYTLSNGTTQVLGNVTSVALTGLICYRNYTFAVQARDAAGNWGPSSSGSFTTSDGCAPSPPGTPTFSSITVTSATASWAAASDNVGVTGYQYRLNGGAWQPLGNVTSVGLSGLSVGTQYTLEIQARDAVGNWGPSVSNSFSTALPAITLPASYQFSSGGTAQFWLERDGDLWHNMSGGIGQDFGDWLSPKAGMSSLEVFATVQAGTCRGTFNVWLPFTNDRSWYAMHTATSGSTSCTVALQIRKIGTTTVLGTGTITARAHSV
jgi:chitodextrinase